MNEPMGRWGSPQAAAAAADGVGDGGDGFVLPDDALMEAFFEDQQLGAFAFEHAGDGDAGPGGDDFGDFVGADFLAEEAAFGGRRSAIHRDRTRSRLYGRISGRLLIRRRWIRFSFPAICVLCRG